MIRFLLSFIVVLFLDVLFLPTSLTGQSLHHRNQDLPCINKNYNIAAHIAVDSINRLPLYTTQDLDTIVAELNRIFSPICVSFSICEYNVLENDYSLGRAYEQPISIDLQLEELKNRFSLRRRINIFFLDFINNEGCGRSTFESILTTKDANIYTERFCADKIVPQIAHHLGHTFGLLNTYDPLTIELVDGSNCSTTGDLLCDTPADPFGQTFVTPEDQILIQQGLLRAGFVDLNCEFIYDIKDPNGEYYQPDVGNIMSAYPCKCGFTQDQYRLMVETILKSNIRHF